MHCDILIKNGCIVDGTGVLGCSGDIAISGDTICAIGQLDGVEARCTIDATGCHVTPGFIDTHTHSDFSLVGDSRQESQIRQGVTTQVVGLCGFSSAPCTEEQRSSIVPPHILNSQWCSFAEYLEALAAASPATNVACLVGHGTLRMLSMPPSSRGRTATEEEIASMAVQLDACLRAGAFGMSSGLEYYPGKAASQYELEQLACVLAEHGAFHACHTRNRDVHALSGYLEVLEVARNTQSHLHISHVNPKFGRQEATMRHVREMIGWMRDEGATVSLDVIPSIWNHTWVSALLPQWALDLPREQLLACLQDRSRHALLTYNASPFMQLHVQGHWDKVFLFDARKTRRHIGKTFAQIAEEYSCSGWEVVFSLLLEEGDEMDSLVFAGDCFSLSDVKEILKDSYCTVCSDTVASGIDGAFKDLHVTPDTYVWCERFLKGSMTGQYGLSFEESVRRLTSLPAEILGIRNRGILKKGNAADIVVLRTDSLADTATMENHAMYPNGIRTVIVNGSVALDSGIRSQEHCGEVLRNNP